MRTTRQLGIRSVAVFSEADQNAMHAGMADEAFLIGKASSSDSYLSISKVLQIAKSTGSKVRH